MNTLGGFEVPRLWNPAWPGDAASLLLIVQRVETTTTSLGDLTCSSFISLLSTLFTVPVRVHSEADTLLLDVAI